MFWYSCHQEASSPRQTTVTKSNQAAGTTDGQACWLVLLASYITQTLPTVCGALQYQSKQSLTDTASGQSDEDNSHLRFLFSADSSLCQINNNNNSNKINQ